MESAKEKIVAMIHEINTKMRELVSYVSSLAFDKVDGTIFDKVDGNAEKPAGSNAGKRVRTRINDGSMSASMIAARISREIGLDIQKDSVVYVGKIVGARPVYYERQHASRYSPDESEKIMNIFRELNKI